MIKNQMRMTHQRDIILRELRKSTAHPTADELYERIKKKLPRISLATVYRNLEILSTAGLIKKLEISGRRKRFDGELRRHHHVYCLLCHRVDNIDLGQDENFQFLPAAASGYRITGCRIEFFGICPDCKKKLKETKKMGCKKCGTETLNDQQQQILKTLAKSATACGSKDIAAAVKLEPKQISSQLTTLKKKGYVASPVRCKYKITEAGKSAIA
ncbi:MAG: Fur family transcriptional regulator [Proteobacteria bacterium]|nr:Fur family transcriptional regulator [Pseudomonadota bacterium]